MRRSVRAAIVLVWVVLVVALVQRHTGPQAPVARLEAAPPSTPADEWMGIYHGGQKIGYAHLAVTPGGDGFEYAEESLLRLTVLETAQTVRVTLRAHTNADFALQTVSFDLMNGTGRFHADGRVDGGALHLQTRIGEESSATDVPLQGPLYLPNSTRRLIAKGSLEAGRRYDVEVFDPTVMSSHRIVTTVQGEEDVPATTPPVRAWRIEEQYGGITGKAWIDRDGKVLREEGPMGLALVSESAAQAVAANWSTGEALDLVASAAVPVDWNLGEPAALARLRLRIGGVDLQQVPSDERQHLAGDVLTIEREAPVEQTSYRLPYAGGDLRAELLPSPLLQSDHPRIRALAAEIAGGEKRPERVARRLEEDVFHRLAKVPTVSIPNALQVLDMGEGDCNEHAVLYAALARAIGLPARVVAGVVFLNGAFYYHAWDEVWLDRWVSLDPVFNQFPADVTHIKFVTGGPEDHLAMIGVIGRLRLEVLPPTSG